MSQMARRSSDQLANVGEFNTRSSAFLRTHAVESLPAWIGCQGRDIKLREVPLRRQPLGQYASLNWEGRLAE
jgi:hypothetical protein